jgi:hypothetical protein
MLSLNPLDVPFRHSRGHLLSGRNLPELLAQIQAIISNDDEPSPRIDISAFQGLF